MTPRERACRRMLWSCCGTLLFFAMSVYGFYSVDLSTDYWLWALLTGVLNMAAWFVLVLDTTRAINKWRRL